MIPKLNRFNFLHFLSELKEASRLSMSDTSKWEMIDWSIKINIDEKNQHNTKVYRVLEDGTNQELRHGETKEFRLPPEDEGSQGSAQGCFAWWCLLFWYLRAYFYYR